MIFIDYHENEVDEALHLEGKEEDVETSYDLKFGHEVEGEEIEEEEEDKKCSLHWVPLPKKNVKYVNETMNEMGLGA